jgi:hypothetical protein
VVDLPGFRREPVRPRARFPGVADRLAGAPRLAACACGQDRWRRLHSGSHDDGARDAGTPGPGVGRRHVRRGRLGTSARR